MKVGLDTNVLAYAEGVGDVARRDAAVAIIARLQQDQTILPVQVLGELFNVLVRRGGRTHKQAREQLLRWSSAFSLIDTTDAAMAMAADLAAHHHFGIWDAVILCTASNAGCRLLLSEDMHDGFTWGGVTVANPFAARPHPLLETILGTATRQE
jgi:predicted nucleic acid-binding protein